MLSLPSSNRSFVRDIQDSAARFAVHGINVMAEETAGRTSEPNLCRTDQHLCKIEEERDAEDHDDDCNQTTGRTGQGDVAKARGRQRGNREIERVRIVMDTRV